MSACLWADIDAYWQAAIRADMGAGSLTTAYTTLLVHEVVIGPEIDEIHAALPAALIVSYQSRQAYGAAGYGTVTVDSTYPYLLCVCDGNESYTQLKINLQIQAKRLVAMVADRFGLGCLTDTEGETANRTQLGETEIEIWGPVEGRYYGICAVPVEVFAQS